MPPVAPNDVSATGPPTFAPTTSRARPTAGHSRFRTTRKEHRLTNTTNDKMTQAAAEKAADSVNAASGTASAPSGGQNPVAGPETMFDSLKRTILGIFKRPS